MATTRGRYKGTGQDFAHLISPICAQKGKVWVKYDEAETVGKTKTLPALIHDSHDLLDILHGGSSSFNFVRSVVKEGIKLEEKKHRDTWKLKEDLREDYYETMTRRVMNLTRAVSQADRKDNLARWVLELPWRVNKGQEEEAAEPMDDHENEDDDSRLDEDEINEDAKLEEKQKKAKPKKDPQADRVGEKYIYGFSEEVKMAWRKLADKSQAMKEPGKVVEFTDNQRDRDPISAVWPDGHNVKIDACSIGQYKALQATTTSSKSNVWWSGEHKHTHHRVSVESLKDRTLLMIVTEQSRQICQVHVKSFAKDGEAPEGKEAQQTAADFMVTLAKEFVDDELKNANDMKKKREERMAEMGIQFRQAGKPKLMGPTQAKTLADAKDRNTRKRPAKAMSPDTQEQTPKATKAEAPNPENARGQKTAKAKAPSPAKTTGQKTAKEEVPSPEDASKTGQKTAKEEAPSPKDASKTAKREQQPPTRKKNRTMQGPNFSASLEAQSMEAPSFACLLRELPEEFLED